MVLQAELILRVIAVWFLVLSHFLERLWVPLISNIICKCHSVYVVQDIRFGHVTNSFGQNLLLGPCQHSNLHNV